MKKSLLNDLIWGVVVTNKGLSIEFRLKHGLNSNGFLSAHSTSPKVAGSVIDLSAHRPSNSSPADASADFHNVEIQKLQVVKNGSQNHILPERRQAHRIIEISDAEKQRISETIVEMYRKGHSLPDIAKLLGKAKDTVRTALLKAGIELRPSVALPVHATWRDPGKRNIRPYYGFCYFQGRVAPDPREYDNLLLIHRLWKKGTNPNRIADMLNEKRIPGRSASSWNRNSVVLILKRFEDGIISIKGDQYELR